MIGTIVLLTVHLGLGLEFHQTVSSIHERHYAIRSVDDPQRLGRVVATRQRNTFRSYGTELGKKRRPPAFSSTRIPIPNWLCKVRHTCAMLPG